MACPILTPLYCYTCTGAGCTRCRTEFRTLGSATLIWAQPERGSVEDGLWGCAFLWTSLLGPQGCHTHLGTPQRFQKKFGSAPSRDLLKDSQGGGVPRARWNKSAGWPHPLGCPASWQLDPDTNQRGGATPPPQCAVPKYPFSKQNCQCLRCRIHMFMYWPVPGTGGGGASLPRHLPSPASCHDVVSPAELFHAASGFPPRSFQRFKENRPFSFRNVATAKQCVS